MTLINAKNNARYDDNIIRKKRRERKLKKGSESILTWEMWRYIEAEGKKWLINILRHPCEKQST